MAQLVRFEEDPAAYNPGGDHAEKLALTDALIDAFVLWSSCEKKNSKAWVARQERLLRWWADRLKGLDLRQVTLGNHIVPALDTVKGKKPRIAVIKAFYGWLRKVRFQMDPSDDPTQVLAVPQPRPAQWVKTKVIPQADHAAVLLAISPRYGDLLKVLNSTGWHVSELLRFAQDGYIEVRDDGTQILLCPQRKSGEIQRTRVSPAIAEVASRVRERGGFGESRLFMAVRDACERAGVTPFGPGQYRHTVATRMINAGADPAGVAAFLGHKSPQTTRRFYATLAAVPRPVGVE